MGRGDRPGKVGSQASLLSRPEQILSPGQCSSIPSARPLRSDNVIGKAERVLIQWVGRVRGPTSQRIQYGLVGLLSSMSAGASQTTRSRCFATRLWFDIRANA